MQRSSPSTNLVFLSQLAVDAVESGPERSALDRRAMGSHDPNFPADLAIKPSARARPGRTGAVADEGTGAGTFDQDTALDIEQFGIAGRIWEAAYALRQYFTPASASSSPFEFDPPCSLFEAGEGRAALSAVELGSGVGYVGIHLALTLAQATSPLSVSHVIVTDLDNVCPLLERNVQTAFSGANSSATAGAAAAGPDGAHQVSVRPLPWGSSEAGAQLLHELKGNPSHIIASDLVYFPELLPPLLRTLIQLSEPVPVPVPGSGQATELIISYKVRSLEKEQPFWQALGAWFDFAPVLARRSARGTRKEGGRWHRFGAWQTDVLGRDDGEEEARAASAQEQEQENGQEQEHEDDTPADDQIYIMVGRRRPESLGCPPPQDDAKLMGGWRGRRKDASSGALGEEDQEGGDTEEEENATCGAGDAFELMLLGDMADA